jgi:hypothetical protein
VFVPADSCQLLTVIGLGVTIIVLIAVVIYF